MSLSLMFLSEQLQVSDGSLQCTQLKLQAGVLLEGEGQDDKGGRILSMDVVYISSSLRGTFWFLLQKWKERCPRASRLARHLHLPRHYKIRQLTPTEI